MKKFGLVFALVLGAGALMAFAEWSDVKREEFRADLDLDGIEDVLIEDLRHSFEDSGDDGYVLKIRIKVTVRLMNRNGSVKKEICFSDDRDMYDDEYDGCLGYSVKDGMIVRELVTGRHSYKNYEDCYYAWDKKRGNWKLVKCVLLEAPMHENRLTEKTFEDEDIYLYDAETMKFSGY